MSMKLPRPSRRESTSALLLGITFFLLGNYFHPLFHHWEHAGKYRGVQAHLCLHEEARFDPVGTLPIRGGYLHCPLCQAPELAFDLPLNPVREFLISVPERPLPMAPHFAKRIQTPFRARAPPPRGRN